MVKKNPAFVTVSYLPCVRPRTQQGSTDRQPHRGENHKAGCDVLERHGEVGAEGGGIKYREREMG